MLRTIGREASRTPSSHRTNSPEYSIPQCKRRNDILLRVGIDGSWNANGELSVCLCIDFTHSRWIYVPSSAITFPFDKGIVSNIRQVSIAIPGLDFIVTHLNSFPLLVYTHPVPPSDSTHTSLPAKLGRERLHNLLHTAQTRQQDLRRMK